MLCSWVATGDRSFCQTQMEQRLMPSRQSIESHITSKNNRSNLVILMKISEADANDSEMHLSILVTITGIGLCTQVPLLLPSKEAKSRRNRSSVRSKDFSKIDSVPTPSEDNTFVAEVRP